jgi:hypothetical protein
MKAKLTTLVFGTLIAGSLVLSAGPASARDWDRRNDADLGRHPHRGWGYPARPVPVPAYPPARVPTYGYPAYGYPAYGYPAAGPAYSQDLYQRLDNARRKKAYDRAHGASREQLAEDNARIARLERQLGVR